MLSFRRLVARSVDRRVLPRRSAFLVSFNVMSSKSLVFAEPLKRTQPFCSFGQAEGVRHTTGRRRQAHYRQKASGTLQAEGGTLQAEGVRHTTGRRRQAHYRQKASGTLQAEDFRHTTGRRRHTTGRRRQAHYRQKTSGTLQAEGFTHTTRENRQAHYRNNTSGTP